MKIKLIAPMVIVLILVSAAIGIKQTITSQIVSTIEREIPQSSGISASIPLFDVPMNITSDSIKSANIDIESFPLRDSNTNIAVNISATNISKSKPTFVGSLELIATIPAATITNSNTFSDAQIVGKYLQVPVGEGGLGIATLIPKYANNLLYFELQSISVFGNEIPTSSLPANIRNEIKSRSQRNFTPPNGLKVESVSLSSDGLSVEMTGRNIQLGNLGASL
jgi:hypothetical protein